jgi:hypothetical protein
VNGLVRNRLAAIDPATGEVDLTWNPNVNNMVSTLAPSSDGRRIFAGGSFTSVGGTTRNRFAAIDAFTGALDTRVKGGTNGTVRTLAVSGNRVYLGGDFSTAKGVSRTRLAMVDGTTGEVDPTWTPAADNSVHALVPSADGSSIYAGGDFLNVSGVSSTRGLVRLDATTGAPDINWRPNPGYPVFEVAVSEAFVYVAGGGVGGRLSAFDATKPLSSGEVAWSLRGDGDIQTVMVRGDKVYAGGHFDTIADQARKRLVAVDAATGAVDPEWTPSVPNSGSQDLGVWAMAGATGPRLFIGGDFDKVANQLQQGYAQFSDPDATAPTLSNVSPADGATGVAASTKVEANFSEAMDPSSLTGATFTLTKSGSATPVEASVTYSSISKKAILDPAADLDPDATYTATIRGGAGGAKDVAGNPLAADVAWSFTTAAALSP